ncbi:hypothetical protein ND856_18625 [Leptospira bandrabouensis]|uniref:hypothetical protein n=1 Tax=Leptospira bandrabouensis TaxID=2484903 RepID=UPI00223E1231|nr:hypothetical protein [Leptospira bandrabouensis]MCW7460161.1 hypothetical protein [Leptospira bandrabouensis]MCW7479322.1 hypothetical protein [Leptospira bandrabouensis]MCW7487004.1 hypothetical protein [Leptospira bandrabouensis]
MGVAISSADLDSDHNLRNEKLSKLIETPTAKATTEGGDPAKDPDSKLGNTEEKSPKANAKDSTKTTAKATTEGGA